jgi:hypothetical protein
MWQRLIAAKAAGPRRPRTRDTHFEASHQDPASRRRNREIVRRRSDGPFWNHCAQARNSARR